MKTSQFYWLVINSFLSAEYIENLLNYILLIRCYCNIHYDSVSTKLRELTVETMKYAKETNTSFGRETKLVTW